MHTYICLYRGFVLVRGDFCLGLLLFFCLPGGFCPGWFLSVPPSVRIHPLQHKANITFNFRFVCMKLFQSVTSHALRTPPSVTNCHTFSDRRTLERDVLYGRPPSMYMRVS